MLPTRDLPQNKIPIQTENEGLGKNIPRKWTGRKSWGSNTYIRSNRLQNKVHKNIPKMTLYNTQGNNLSKRHKHYKHICT